MDVAKGLIAVACQANGVNGRVSRLDQEDQPRSDADPTCIYDG